jgi:predicted nucleic acid-binding protein
VRCFADTNLLVCLRDSRDRRKQRSAALWMTWLWESRAGRISTRVLHEYYVTVTAKLSPGLPLEEAREDVMALTSWHPVVPSMDLIEAAWRVQDPGGGFSFRDCLIVAAAGAAACDVITLNDPTLFASRAVGSETCCPAAGRPCCR